MPAWREETAKCGVAGFLAPQDKKNNSVLGDDQIDSDCNPCPHFPVLDATGKLPDGILADVLTYCDVLELYSFNECSFSWQAILASLTIGPIPHGNAIEFGSFQVRTVDIPGAYYQLTITLDRLGSPYPR